jgi:hypothetical protein
MYPVIPIPTLGQHPRKDVTRTLGSSPKEWAQPGSPEDAVWRVRAGVTIPAGITVGPYPSEMLLGTNTSDRPKGDKYIEVSYTL